MHTQQKNKNYTPATCQTEERKLITVTNAIIRRKRIFQRKHMIMFTVMWSRTEKEPEYARYVVTVCI